MNFDVSVVIPNYNCQQYLAKCLSSVAMQSKVNVEIIVIDDGSSDDSVEWLMNIQNAVPNLVLLQQENKGVVAARNTAISAARGEFIAFLDADDYWTTDKLFTQIEFMRNNSTIVLSFTNYMHVTEDGKDIVDCFGYWSEFHRFEHNSRDYFEMQDPYSFIMYANVIGTSTVVARKEAIEKVGGFSSTLKSASDWDCWLKLANIGTFAYTYDVSMAYLMRSNSITSNRRNRLDAMQAIWQNALSRVPVSTSTRVKMYARWLESLSEYHDINRNMFRSFWYSCGAAVLFPHKRNIRRAISLVARCLKVKAYHEKNTTS
ncbi:hypothetical protein PALB_28970 [Pseudoalteromonas luteoviolacea B = ATCC 29581]|nr:hypothetical protein PALB_28970 [Pseudoalteromonas luteoviolacea B = ATCC 29581]